MLWYSRKAHIISTFCYDTISDLLHFTIFSPTAIVTIANHSSRRYLQKMPTAHHAEDREDKKSMVSQRDNEM